MVSPCSVDALFVSRNRRRWRLYSLSLTVMLPWSIVNVPGVAFAVKVHGAGPEPYGNGLTLISSVGGVPLPRSLTSHAVSWFGVIPSAKNVPVDFVTVAVKSAVSPVTGSTRKAARPDDDGGPTCSADVQHRRPVIGAGLTFGSALGFSPRVKLLPDVRAVYCMDRQYRSGRPAIGNDPLGFSATAGACGTATTDRDRLLSAGTRVAAARPRADDGLSGSLSR
jgi:hypothetical protein